MCPTHLIILVLAGTKVIVVSRVTSYHSIATVTLNTNFRLVPLLHLLFRLSLQFLWAVFKKQASCRRRHASYDMKITCASSESSKQHAFPLLFSKLSRADRLWSPPSILSGSLSFGIRRTRREAECSALYSGRVRKSWVMSPVLIASSMHDT